MRKLLNKRNVIIAVAVVAALAIGVAIGTFSKPAQVKNNKFVETAKGYVPETAEYVSSEEDDRFVEVRFVDKSNQMGYEVEVNKESGEVKQVEMQRSGDLGGKEVKLSSEDAQKIIKEKFEGVQSATAVLTQDNGLFEYEVSFKADDFYGDADVNAENGQILDSVVRYGKVTTIPVNNSSEKEIIGYEEAESLVIKQAGGGTVRSIDLDKENQDFFYEIELHKDGMEKEYIVNAKTSEVIFASEHECYFKENHEKDNNVRVKENEVKHSEDSVSNVDKSNLISKDEAKSIVFKKIPNAEIIEFQLDEDDGIFQYEGEAHLNGYKYEFEINASSGVIIGWEKERLGYDD